METLHNLFHRYLDELDRHREKYENLACEAKAGGDRDTYNKIRIQLGMLDMSEVLFIKSCASEIGLLPRRERRPRRAMPEKWPEDKELSPNERRLGTLMRYGKLIRIPASYKKKRMVMDLLAERFDPHREYDESEVNDLISEIHHDFCTWRRLLVDEGYLSREDGVYRAV